MAQAENVTLTRQDLQDMMVAVVKAAKEPTEAEAAKIKAEQEKLLRQAKEMADLAKVQEHAKSQRWNGCPHAETFQGRTRHKWNGQVNSNGFVVPVCNICHIEAPAFSANLLPDGGKQGVNFENWVRCDKDLLAELHKKSFTGGKCTKSGCLVCDPRKG